MRNERPGDAEHARITREWPIGQLRQLLVIARWQIGADLQKLRLDEVIVVDQLFGGRRDGAAVLGCLGDGELSAEQCRTVAAQAGPEGLHACNLAVDRLGVGEASGTDLQPLDAEQCEPACNIDPCCGVIGVAILTPPRRGDVPC